MAKIRKQGDAYQVDFYLYGVRFRKHFSTEAEAREFKRRMESSLLLKETPIDIAISHYKEIESRKKTHGNFTTEGLFFYELTYFLGTQGIPKTEFVSEVKPYHMDRFQAWLKTQTHNGKHFSNSTVNRRFNTIKGFFTKCVEWEYIKESPCRFIRSLPETPKKRRVWKREEILALRFHLDDDERALFDFLLETGARLSSAIALDWADVDLESGIASFLTRKGRYRRERLYTVPLSPRAQEILKALCPQKVGKVWTMDGPLFSKRIQRKIKKAHLDGLGLTLHGLRHTYATRLHERGASTESIRRLLGHESTKTTQVYLTSDIEHLRSLVS